MAEEPLSHAYQVLEPITTLGLQRHPRRVPAADLLLRPRGQLQLEEHQQGLLHRLRLRGGQAGVRRVQLRAQGQPGAPTQPQGQPGPPQHAQ